MKINIIKTLIAVSAVLGITLAVVAPATASENNSTFLFWNISSPSGQPDASSCPFQALNEPYPTVTTNDPTSITGSYGEGSVTVSGGGSSTSTGAILILCLGGNCTQSYDYPPVCYTGSGPNDCPVDKIENGLGPGCGGGGINKPCICL